MTFFRLLTVCLFLGWSALLHAQELPETEHVLVDVTTSEGLILKTSIDREVGATARLPGLLMTQAVSCGRIIAPIGSRTASRVAAAGFALIRVDRSGTGESEGPGCDRLDYVTEVRHYREALEQLRNHPWIDPERIVIYGDSLGSTTAPLVALDNNVSGVLVQGAGALTYYERMIHFDRIQLERQRNFDPERLHDEMMRRMEFHRHYLLKEMTPTEIEAAYPHLQGVWASMRGTADAFPHYGRPFAWHWQAARQNWLGAWAKIDAPVMVVYGEYEQFETRHGHRLIVDTVNRLRPGTAAWLEVPKAGHGLSIYPDPYDALNFENGERQPDLFWRPVTDWLRRIAAG